MDNNSFQQIEEKLGETIVAYHLKLESMKKKDTEQYLELRNHFNQLKSFLGHIKVESLINAQT